MSASIIISIDSLQTHTKTFFYLLSVYPTIPNYEIIIVDDSEHHDIDCDFFNVYPTLNYKLITTTHKMGYGKANNLGAKNASNDILVFMNDDIILDNNCLEIITTDIISGIADAVQPKLVYPQTGKIQSTGHTFTEYSNAHIFENASENTVVASISGKRSALTTALCATKKVLFEKMGGFNEAYFNAWEGMEYCLKLSANGYTCYYDSNAKAYHIRGGARGMYKLNESSQSAYFWSKWKGLISEDLHVYYNLQLNDSVKNRDYFVLNFSNVTDAIAILKKCGFQTMTQINYMHYSGLSCIDFLKLVPFRLCQYNHPLIYFCDNQKQVVNNVLWFKYRRESSDIIMDLSGNVLFTYQILVSSIIPASS